MGQTILGILVTISLFVGLLGCGSAASDNRSSHDSPTGVSELPEMQSSSVAGNATPSSPIMEAPSLPQPDDSVPRSKPFVRSDPKATLQDLEVQERLNKLNYWAHEGAPGGILALMPALSDPDERVRARAEELRRELSAKSDADD